jgi:hypothetical protein
VLGLEEAEERLDSIGQILDRPLRGGDDGEPGVLLDEGPELLLAGLAQSRIERRGAPPDPTRERQRTDCFDLALTPQPPVSWQSGRLLPRLHPLVPGR